jgi:hypothetical protein
LRSGGRGRPANWFTTEATESTEIGTADERGWTPQVYPLVAGATSFAVTHTYADDNPTETPSDSYQVSGTLTDDEGGATTFGGPAGAIDNSFGTGGTPFEMLVL